MNLRGSELLMILIFLGLLALAIWLAFWIGKKAEQKGYSRVGFTILGLFFTLIALIVVLVLPETRERLEARLPKCPYCAEAIQPVDKVCRHCSRDISPSVS